MATESNERPVFFFDIDNCLYSRSKKVQDMMRASIRKYFREHLELTEADALKLQETYYQIYGLAIEGLVRHHKIDPLEYNRKVDDALPLEDILHPDADLRKLISDINRSKVKLWLFTNAYKTHGQRVIRMLGIDDLFDAMRDAGIMDRKKCYFIDDSYLNCEAAIKFGWEKVVHKLEPEDPNPTNPATKYHIRSLEELRVLFPEIF